MMKKVVGTFERVSDASGAVRAVRTAGFLASDVELVVRSVDVGVADGDPASTASGAASRIVAAALAGGVLGGLAIFSLISWMVFAMDILRDYSVSSVVQLSLQPEAPPGAGHDP